MNAWRFVYEDYDPAREGRREALCTLGNGYFATRGAAPDSDADDIHYPGTHLAGGYNRLTTRVGGRDIENEDLVNLPNWLPLTFRVDGDDWFRTDAVEILSYRQELDLKAGLLRRDIRFRDGSGRTTTPEGIHVGAMAGTIDLVQRCYLGVETRENVLNFDPALPDGLGRVKVRLRYRRQILDIDADHDLLTITSRPFPANPITVAYRGHHRDVAPGDTYQFRLLRPEERDRDENRAKPAPVRSESAVEALSDGS